MIKLFKNLIRGKSKKSSIKQFKMGLRSLDNGIKISIRKNSQSDITPSYTNLTIGEDSIVAGTFVFENGLGQVTVGNRSFVGGGDFICIDKIDIGDDVLISWGCTFMDNDAHSLDFELRKEDVKNWKRGLEENKIGFHKDWKNVKRKPIVIKNSAWIGFKAIILKGVTIGEGAVVGSGSVVTKDVPDWTVIAGNPAQIVKRIK